MLSCLSRTSPLCPDSILRIFHEIHSPSHRGVFTKSCDTSIQPVSVAGQQREPHAPLLWSTVGTPVSAYVACIPMESRSLDTQLQESKMCHCLGRQAVLCVQVRLLNCKMFIASKIAGLSISNENLLKYQGDSMLLMC